MEDQQPDPGDLTTDPDRAGESETSPEAAVEKDSPPAAPAGRRSRWPFRRRRKAAASGESDPESDEATEPAPAARMPVGKSRRSRLAPLPSATTEDAEATEEAEAPQAAEPAEAAEDAEDAELTESITAALADEESEVSEDATDPDDQEPGDPDAEVDEPEPEPILVPHRPAGRRLIAAGIAAGVLFVGAAAFAGAQLQPYLADQAAVDTKLDIARTAAEAINTLWTYTPDDMQSLPDRSSRYLAGDFAAEYRKYIDAIVATNKQAQVTNTTEVMGTAVESLTPTEATALVYTNSVSTSPVNKNIPSLRYLSYRLTLQRDGADWMITRMNAVTSLDLTPQL